MPTSEDLPTELTLPETTPKPFCVEIRQRPMRGNSFVPEAVLCVRPSLRTGGLLAALAPEQARDLLWLLTFVSPNGDVTPTLLELKESLNVSEGKARARLERLVAFRWQGEAIVAEIRRESGLHAFAPTPAIVETVSVAPTVPEEAPRRAPMAIRDAIVAHSRASYARPKAEVEREIARLNGWPDPDEDAGTKDARDRLLLFGVPRETAEGLIRAHGTEAVLRQAKWLPYRHAKRPAQLLVAAIENDYAEPASVRFARGSGTAGDSPALAEETEGSGPHA